MQQLLKIVQHLLIQAELDAQSISIWKLDGPSYPAVDEQLVLESFWKSMMAF